MALSTTIKSEYMKLKLEDLVKDKFFIEYKDRSEHWEKRVISGAIAKGERAVFLYTPDKKTVSAMFLIDEVKIINTDEVPERFRLAINTPSCYAIKCVLMPNERGILN